MLSVISPLYAECHYAECHSAQCQSAECRGTLILAWALNRSHGRTDKIVVS